MTSEEMALTIKNLEMWQVMIAKYEAREDTLTDAEKRDLQRRRAQCVIWTADLEDAVES